MNKKLIAFLLSFLLLFSSLSPSYPKASLSNLNDEINSLKIALADLQLILTKIMIESGAENTYIGRLYIPSVGINVGLYKGMKQYITDNEDSANFFYSRYRLNRYIIVDHNDEGFTNLPKVKVGTKAYIVYANGAVQHMECTDVLNGHNDRSHITDGQGNNLVGKADFLMYTCLDHWTNVRVCMWKRVE